MQKRTLKSVAIIGSLGAFMITTSSAQVFDCGAYGQRYCQRNYYMNETVIEGTPYCNAGLAVSGYHCDVNRNGWTTKGLDMTRSGSEMGTVCGGSASISCWRVDDESRDHLNMNSTALNFVTEVGLGTAAPSSGRFIFVYRAKDNRLLMRRYDRAHTEGDPTLSACLNYGQYRYASNMRGSTYQHIRHSQLNGGWEPVYCAGEVSFKDGKLWRLNNASGHYQPDASCLANVESTMTLSGYALHPDYQRGPHDRVHATETSCPPPVGPDPGPDEL